MASLFAKKYSRWFSMKMRTRSSASLDSFSRSCKSLDNRPERMFLDQVKQVFLGLKIMVETGQRHTGRAGKVAHGSAFIAFFTEDMGGMVQQFGQPAVKAGIRCFSVASKRSSSFAAVKGLAGQPGFHVLQRHQGLRLPNVRSILNYRLQVAARSNPAPLPNSSLQCSFLLGT